MRILVTGSRTWTDEFRVRFELRKAGAAYLPSSITIVHGGCPSGADAMADRFAADHNLSVERNPANWERGRQAGFIRNAEMVRAGADLCLAFIRQGSRGASHCADLAEKAGIPVRRFVDDTEPVRVVPPVWKGL